MRRSLRRGCAGAGVVLVAWALSACGGHQKAPPTPGGPAWTTYGFDVQHSGFNGAERRLGTGTVARLREIWSAPLGGVSDTQPLVATGVSLPGGARGPVVYAGSERGALTALAASDGHRLWRRQLGSRKTECRQSVPEGVFGVTGTPVLDRAANRLYAVGGDGKAYALDLSTGAVERVWTVTDAGAIEREHVWGGLTLWRGSLYIPVASYCDMPPYAGKLVRIDVKTGRQTVWRPAGRHSGGGIWGWGGVSVDPKDGDVYAATGNSFRPTEHEGFSERVVRLDRALRVRASDYPHLVQVTVDRDFGSTPLLIDVAGCPPLLAAENKTGLLLVYDRGQIARGARQRLELVPPRAAKRTPPLIGLPAFEPALRTLYVTTPIAGGGQILLALRLTSSCQLRPAWRARLGGRGAAYASSPTLANGVVYVGDGSGGRAHAFDARTGAELWSSGSAVRGQVFVAPTVVGSRVYVAAWDGRLHAFGVP